MRSGGLWAHFVTLRKEATHINRDYYNVPFKEAVLTNTLWMARAVRARSWGSQLLTWGLVPGYLLTLAAIAFPCNIQSPVHTQVAALSGV